AHLLDERPVRAIPLTVGQVQERPQVTRIANEWRTGEEPHRGAAVLRLRVPESEHLSCPERVAPTHALRLVEDERAPATLLEDGVPVLAWRVERAPGVVAREDEVGVGGEHL